MTPSSTYTQDISHFSNEKAEQQTRNNHLLVATCPWSHLEWAQGQAVSPRAIVKEIKTLWRRHGFISTLQVHIRALTSSLELLHAQPSRQYALSSTQEQDGPLAWSWAFLVRFG